MKSLTDLISRTSPLPWSGCSKLPWNEPQFSARMLTEHLSQAHNRASRKSERIDQHVAWIHHVVLGGRPGRVLDLGCGPGLYTARLARLGHQCVGIDFSPASIAYAEEQARSQQLACDYRRGDLRNVAFGAGFDAVLFVYGEFNTFPPHEARQILAAAREALAPRGSLVLEVHTDEYVRSIGSEGASWFTEEAGLFSERPYLCLRECNWHAGARASIERYIVVDLATSHVATYTSTTQAYSAMEYDAVLRESGFNRFTKYPGLPRGPDGGEPGMSVIVAGIHSA